MFVEYIYIVQLWNGTLKHFEIKTFYFNWKNKTPIKTELTKLWKHTCFLQPFLNPKSLKSLKVQNRNLFVVGEESHGTGEKQAEEKREREREEKQIWRAVPKNKK